MNLCKTCGKEIEQIRNSGAKYCLDCAVKRRNRFVPSNIIKNHPEASLIDVFLSLEGRIRELEEKLKDVENVDKWVKDHIDNYHS